MLCSQRWLDVLKHKQCVMIHSLVSYLWLKALTHMQSNSKVLLVFANPSN